MIWQAPDSVIARPGKSIYKFVSIGSKLFDSCITIAQEVLASAINSYTRSTYLTYVLNLSVKKETTETTATEPNLLQIIIQYFGKSEKIYDSLASGNPLEFEEFLRANIPAFRTQVTRSLVQEFASQRKKL
jgi:hypothetical protein